MRLQAMVVESQWTLSFLLHVKPRGGDRVCQLAQRSLTSLVKKVFDRMLDFTEFGYPLLTQTLDPLEVHIGKGSEHFEERKAKFIGK